MRRLPNDNDWDDDDELNDAFFDDIGSGLGLISPDMAEDMARMLADEWREREERKLIKLDLTLMVALNKTPAKWLDAACIANHISKRGQRKQKVAQLVALLADWAKLAELVGNTPAHARIVLRRVLESGGWIKLNTLIKDYGDLTGDGWFWDEIPPTSSIGELRHRGLLFVGKAMLGKTTKKGYKVAVVPKDLRESLAKILNNPTVRAEEQDAVVSRFESPESILRDALQDVRNYFAEVDWEMIVTESDVATFLRDAHAQGFDAIAVWQSLSVVLDFLDHYAHELTALDDLASYHVSELVHEFVDHHYLPRIPIGMRRDLLETVHRFYQHLHTAGRVNDEVMTEVNQAVERIGSGKRKLNVVRRPPPLGGEVVMMRMNPNTGLEERYTINHQRLLLVWATDFHQDWRHMLQMCQNVPDGARKAELVQELMSLEPMAQDVLLTRADDDDVDSAIEWFNQQNVIELSAW
jgi:hypothetical protein